MTDKQIIIDGVDVSDCEHLEYKGCDFPQCLIKTASFDLKCEGYNCYLKRYKHKEQVFNEIKEYFKSKDKTKTTLFNIFVIEEEILDIINKG